MLDLMRATRDAGSGPPLSRDAICDQIGTMLSAGFATTALALYWTALMLALFPEHQEAVRRELCPGLKPDSTGRAGAPPPDMQALRSSPVATAFLYESLRLYPPAYIIVREAKVEDRIGDFRIPRGAAVIVSPWLVHRHSALWPDPQRLRSGPLPAGRAHCAAESLDALRHRSAGLHRHGLRDNGDPRDPALPAGALFDRSGRRSPIARRSGDVAAGLSNLCSG